MKEYDIKLYVQLMFPFQCFCLIIWYLEDDYRNGWSPFRQIFYEKLSMNGPCSLSIAVLNYRRLLGTKVHASLSMYLDCVHRVHLLFIHRSGVKGVSATVWHEKYHGNQHIEAIHRITCFGCYKQGVISKICLKHSPWNTSHFRPGLFFLLHGIFDSL